MANLLGLTDLQWGLLANDAYRRYAQRGDGPEAGYDNHMPSEFNFRRYPDINKTLKENGWKEYTLSGLDENTLLNLDWHIFEPLNLKDSSTYDYQGGIVNAFSARVYVNANTKQVIVSFRGSESFEEVFSSGNGDATNDWIGNYGVILKDQIHEQVNAAYYFTQQLKEILDADPILSEGYQLAFTGHSLGGYLASVISTIELAQDIIHVPVGGQNAVVFNPFGATDTINTIFQDGAPVVSEEIGFSKDMGPKIAYHVPSIPNPTVDPPSSESNVRIVYNDFDMARRGELWNEIVQKEEAWGLEANPLADFNPNKLNPLNDAANISKIHPFYHGSIAESLTKGDFVNWLLAKKFNATPEQAAEFLTFSRIAHSIDNQLLVMASAKNLEAAQNGTYELSELLEKVPTFYLAMGESGLQLEEENVYDPLKNGFVISSLQMELVKDRLAKGYENGYENSVLRQMVESLKLIAGADLIASVEHTDRQGYYKIQESLSEILIESLRGYFKTPSSNWVSPFVESSNHQYFVVKADEKDEKDEKHYLGEERFIAALEADAMFSNGKMPDTGTFNIYEDFQSKIGQAHEKFDNYIISLRDTNKTSLDASITTSARRDVVIVMEGNDTIIDDDGDDAYFSGKGDDKIVGGIGSDFIHGGFGYQKEFLEKDGNDSVDYSNLGTSQVIVNASKYQVSINLASEDPDSNAPFYVNAYDFPYYIVDKVKIDTGAIFDTDYLVSIEYVIGTEGDDIFIAGTGVDKFSGGNGVDTYKYSSTFGHDTIIGGAGDIDSNDVIEINGQIFSGIANKNTGSDNYTLLGKTIQILNGDIATEATIKIIDGANSIEVENFTNGDYGITLGKVDANIENGKQLFDRALILRRDPLMIDLDGDGIELISPESSRVFFDLDDDNTTEKVGWVAPDDGLFALDRNGNGKIDNINELFGSPDQTGFEELATLDSNADKVINNQDVAYNDILVWQDKSSNGIADTGEIKSLMQAGISSISLDAEALNPERVVEGNIVPEISVATLYGQENEVAEVLLTLDTTATLDQPDGSGVATLPETLLLPQSRGYGSLLALDKAMSTDPILLKMMQDFVAMDITSVTANDLINAVRNILFQWAGVANVDPAGRGTAVNGQELAFLERLYGSSYLFNGSIPNPPIGEPANGINQAWDEVYDVLSARLLAQGPLSDIFQGILYDAANDGLLFSSSIKEIINNIDSLGDNDLQLLAFSVLVSNFSGVSNYSDLGINFEIVNALLSLTRNIITTKGQFIVGTDGSQDYIFGTSDNEVIIGAKGADFIDGGDGDDVYFYSIGDGRDTIHDFLDNNVLQFGEGITQEDIILDISGGGNGAAVIQFKHSLTSFSPDVIYIKSNPFTGWIGNLTLRFEDGKEIDLAQGLVFYGTENSDSITGTIYGDYIIGGSGNDSLNGSILEFTIYQGQYFLAGSSDTIIGGPGNDYLSASGLNVYLDGGPGTDRLYGNRWFSGSSYLFGGTGNDSIYGIRGQNTLAGGEGNDILEGSSIWISNNIFIIERETSATDRIINFKVIYDKLDVSGIDVEKFSDLNLSQNGKNVVLDLGNNNTYILENVSLTSLTPNNFIFTGDDQKLWGSAGADTVSGFGGNDTLSGGAGDDTLTGQGGNDQLDGDAGNDFIDGGEGDDTLFGDLGDDALLGGSGNDFLHGGNGNDTLNGGAGNDELHGGQGEDIYVFAAGGGFDTIIDTGGVDTLKLEGGLTPENLKFTQVGDDLVIDIASGVTIVGQFSGDQDDVLEFASFDDGTIVELPNALLPINQPPAARNDDFTLDEDSYLINNVLINDDDPNDDELSVQSFSLITTSGASVELLTSGVFIYTPAPNFNGVDSFDYTILDSRGESDKATVMINVNPVNDNPEASNDSFATNVNTLLSGNVLVDNGYGADADIDLDFLSVEPAVITTASGASVNLRADGSFDYLPSQSFNGIDSFNYTLLDGQGGFDIGTVSLNIYSVNNPPEAVDDHYTGKTDQQISGNVLSNDSDIDNNLLAVISNSFTTSQGGIVSILQNGKFTYTPASGFSGLDSFSYTLVDEQGDQDSAIVNITIEEPVNEVLGTVASDNLIGTAGDDVLRSLAGSYDKMSGGLGTDIFVFGSETLNGARERDVILDYEVGVDAIFLDNAASIGSIRATSTGAVIFLEGDLDAIYVQGVGVLPGNLTFIPENIFMM